MQLPLTSCYLAVLSACDSARGARSVGQGHASLHMALHSGGARFVVCSLWQVGDRAAQLLMTEFYRRLWARPDAPHRALWEAKMVARRAGSSFRDWAGFLITGA